ncbi:hypothetical protein AMS62_09750 [Bacillus sp. FJAT-18019]|nr:hypothetical protein AMS62_09750 [Bacillus sp. FJAT-18019]
MIDESSNDIKDLLVENNKVERRNKSSKPKSSRSKEPKVKDLIVLLQHCIDISKSPLLGGSPENFMTLEKVKSALLKQKNMPLNEFIYKVEQLPSNKESKEKTSHKDLSIEEIQKLTVGDIRALCQDHTEVSKATLDRIGHERFGLSMSQLKSGSKEKSIRLLLSSIENLDILHSIAEIAKSPSTGYNQD